MTHSEQLGEMNIEEVKERLVLPTVNVLPVPEVPNNGYSLACGSNKTDLP